jgi:hypothetical protein
MVPFPFSIVYEEVKGFSLLTAAATAIPLASMQRGF